MKSREELIETFGSVIALAKGKQIIVSDEYQGTDAERITDLSELVDFLLGISSALCGTAAADMGFDKDEILRESADYAVQLHKEAREDAELLVPPSETLQ